MPFLSRRFWPSLLFFFLINVSTSRAFRTSGRFGPNGRPCRKRFRQNVGATVVSAITNNPRNPGDVIRNNTRQFFQDLRNHTYGSDMMGHDYDYGMNYSHSHSNHSMYWSDMQHNQQHDWNFTNMIWHGNGTTYNATDTFASSATTTGSFSQISFSSNAPVSQDDDSFDDDDSWEPLDEEDTEGFNFTANENFTFQGFAGGTTPDNDDGILIPECEEEDEPIIFTNTEDDLVQTEAPFDAPTPPPTSAPFISPTPAPTTLSPVDQAFLDPDRVSTVHFALSVATRPLPPDKNLRTSAWRLHQLLVDIMQEVVTNRTKFTFTNLIAMPFPIRGPRNRPNRSSTSLGIRSASKRFTFPRPPGRYLQEMELEPELRYNLTESMVELYSKNESDLYWWRHVVALDTIESNATEVEYIVAMALYDAIEDGDFLGRMRDFYSGVFAVVPVGFEFVDPTIINSGPVDGVDEEESTLNLRIWDIRQWIGLIIFGVTLIGLLSLTRTAQVRRKKVQEADEWGVRWGTEKDVNELLTYGWQKSEDDAHLHIFDKQRIGYVDDDSILLGGHLPEMTLPSSSVTSPSTSTSKSERDSLSKPTLIHDLEQCSHSSIKGDQVAPLSDLSSPSSYIRDNKKMKNDSDTTSLASGDSKGDEATTNTKDSSEP